MVNRLITGFITILVGTSLLPFYSGMDLYGYTFEEKKQVPYRQTYKEYVQERLEIERMMR